MGIYRILHFVSVDSLSAHDDHIFIFSPFLQSIDCAQNYHFTFYIVNDLNTIYQYLSYILSNQAIIEANSTDLSLVPFWTVALDVILPRVGTYPSIVARIGNTWVEVFTPCAIVARWADAAETLVMG